MATWLVDELETRGWSRSEAARRGHVSSSMFDKVINGHARPGLDFCRGIARAFCIPPEEVFRRAGLLPPEPEANRAEREYLYVYRQLPEHERRHALVVARALLEEHLRENPIPRKLAKSTE